MSVEGGLLVQVCWLAVDLPCSLDGCGHEARANGGESFAGEGSWHVEVSRGSWLCGPRGAGLCENGEVPLDGHRRVEL